jgi:hypothetical protein
MIKVGYVKFYQAVQVGLHQESNLGTALSKNKDVELTYEHGLLKISNIVGADGAQLDDVYVPFSNIMYFSAQAEESRGRGRPRKDQTL